MLVEYQTSDAAPEYLRITTELSRLHGIALRQPCTPQCGCVCSEACVKLHEENRQRMDALFNDFMMLQQVECARQRRHFIDELGRLNNHIFRRVPFETVSATETCKRSHASMEEEQSFFSSSSSSLSLEDVLSLDGACEGLNGRVLQYLGPCELFAFYRVSRRSRRLLCLCMRICVEYQFRSLWPVLDGEGEWKKDLDLRAIARPAIEACLMDVITRSIEQDVIEATTPGILCAVRSFTGYYRGAQRACLTWGPETDDSVVSITLRSPSAWHVPTMTLVIEPSVAGRLLPLWQFSVFRSTHYTEVCRRARERYAQQYGTETVLLSSDAHSLCYFTLQDWRDMALEPVELDWSLSKKDLQAIAESGGVEDDMPQYFVVDQANNRIRPLCAHAVTYEAVMVTDYTYCALKTWSVSCPLLGSVVAARPDLLYDRLDDRYCIDGNRDYYDRQSKLRHVARCIGLLADALEQTGSPVIQYGTLLDELCAEDPGSPDRDCDGCGDCGEDEEDDDTMAFKAVTKPAFFQCTVQRKQ